MAAAEAGTGGQAGRQVLLSRTAPMGPPIPRNVAQDFIG